jgi:tRNA acetyltransferase TAN1
MWFVLLMCGDKYPVISHLEYSGLLTVFTTLDNRNVISQIKELLQKDPQFFQYILKIVPIDFVCEMNINTIKTLIESHYKNFIAEEDSFKIDLKRRSNESIDRMPFIGDIAEIFNNEVDLSNPNKIVRIEILGNLCGISFVKPAEILKIAKFKNG